MVKVLSVIIAIAFASIAGAQSSADIPKDQQPSKANQASGHSKSPPEKPPLTVKLLNTGKSDAEAAQEAQQIEEAKKANRHTFWLTVALFGATFLQFLALLWQGRELRRTVDSSERSAMPFLHPRATKFNLYPNQIEDGATHSPSIGISFENFGNTPAIMRRAGIQLFVTERDILPPEPPAIQQIRGIVRSDVIAPGQMGGHKVWQLGRVLSAGELRELAAGTKGSFKRIYAIGYVVYDDFFNMRHISRFCLKVRQNKFQAIRGGARFNTIYRQRAPKTEPANEQEEE